MPKKLTNISNKPGERDVYGKTVWKDGDEFPPFSTRDPAGSGGGPLGVGLGAYRAGELETENPLAGDFNADGATYCDTCKMSVSIVGMSDKTHIGHALRYGDEKTNFDVENVHSAGGDYKLGFDVKGNDGAYAAEANQSENPSLVSDASEAGPDTIAESYPQSAQNERYR